MGGVGDGLTEPEAATGSNHGHGSNGQEINDHHNQEVNITNIDPGSPSATGILVEGVNQRQPQARLFLERGGRNQEAAG